MTTQTPQDREAGEPGTVLRVVRGEPTAEELAALVAVLASRSTKSGRTEQAARSSWRDRNGYVRETLPHGPGAWRASAFPR
jgi:hypothetical protein